MKKLLASALIAALSVTLLAGCGAKKEEDITLKVWCPQNQVETGIMEKQQKAFEEAHPEWKINWVTEVVGEDVAKEQILKDPSVAGDVFFYASDQLPELVAAGAIARLGGDTEKMVNETIAESVVATAKVGEALYGIPFTHNTFFMYYDKTLLNDDDIKSLEKIVAKDTAKDVYNFYFESAGGWKLGCYYYGAGLNVFGPNGDDLKAGCNWNNETGIAVTKYLIDLINNPKVAYDGEVKVEELAASHRIGAWFDGSWNFDLYKGVLGDDLGMAVIPTFNFDGTDRQLLSFYGSKCIGVNAMSKNAVAAVAFATFLGNEENQTLRYEMSAQIPANINAGNSEKVKADPLATVIVNEANTASVAQPASTVFSNRYWTPAGAIATEIRSGLLTKDNVQVKMDQFVKTLTAE